MSSFRDRKSFQRFVRTVRILSLIWILLPGTAVAWHTLTHQYLDKIAFHQMPTDFQICFQAYFSHILSGSIAPDIILGDWSNHEWNIHSEEGHQGGAPARIETLFTTTLKDLKAQRPDYHTIADNLGLISHYLADINQPLHTDETDLERLFHIAYECDVYIRQKDFSFIDHGRTFFLEPQSETILMALNANRYYDQILESYASGAGYNGVERITGLCLQNAVDAITDVWTTLWKNANTHGPHIGIKTNQAYFLSEETVEILLSTLDGNTPSLSVDIYVALADQRDSLWFIDSEGILTENPMPCLSGKPLLDHKTVILSVTLGEIELENCYNLYAVVLPTGENPLEPRNWLTQAACARFCLSPP